MEVIVDVNVACCDTVALTLLVCDIVLDSERVCEADWVSEFDCVCELLEVELTVAVRLVEGV